LSEIRIVAPISKNCNDAVTLVKKEWLRLPTLEERKALFVLSKVLRVPYSGKFSAVLYSGWLYLPEELKDIFNEGHWRFRSADDIDVYNGDGSISSSKDNQGYQGYSVLGVRDGEKNLGGKRIKLSKLGDYRDTPFCECCWDCSCSFY
jgi:hypothetical protein